MDQETGIPLDTAAIVSIVLEGVIYGISVVMFLGTIWILMRRRTQSRVNRGMAIVACLMLLLGTAHLIINIVRAHEGLVQYRNTFQPDGPIGFFSDVSQWSFVYKHLLYVLQTLVADGVLIYRCYVVWESWWIVVLLTALWASVGVTGFGCVYIVSRATIDKEYLLAPTTRSWITALLVVSIFTNIISTGLLAFRIWKVGKRLSKASPHEKTWWPVVCIVLDAGVLYSVSLLIVLICFLIKNQGHYVMMDMLMPTVSITFYMVIVRTTLSRSTLRSITRTFPNMPGENTISLTNTEPTEVYITQLTEIGAAKGYADRNKEPRNDEEMSWGASAVLDTAAV